MWMQTSLDGFSILSCAACGDGLRSRPTYDGDQDEYGRPCCVRRQCCKKRVKDHQSGLAALRLQSRTATFPEIRRKFERDWVRPMTVQVRDGMVAEARRLLRIAREAGGYEAGAAAIRGDLKTLKRFGLIDDYYVGCFDRRVNNVGLTLSPLGGCVQLSWSMSWKGSGDSQEWLDLSPMR